MQNIDDFPENVKEVISFALKGDFLYGKSVPVDLNVKCVKKYPDDWLDAGPDGKKYHELQDDEKSYREILEENRSIINKETITNPQMKYVCGKARRILTGQKRIYQLIKVKLQSDIKDFDIYADLIIDDILSCAEWRICFGIKAGFWETVFQIYKTGGMPVGWSGKYPDGKFMVIYPGLKIC